MARRIYAFLLCHDKKLYAANALLIGAVAWFALPTLCFHEPKGCFREMGTSLSYFLGAAGALLLYGWKAFIEFRTRKPMRIDLLGPGTPGVAFVIAGKHLLCGAAAWLVLTFARSLTGL